MLISRLSSIPKFGAVSLEIMRGRKGNKKSVGVRKKKNGGDDEKYMGGGQ